MARTQRRTAQPRPTATQPVGYGINWMAGGRFGDFITPLSGQRGLIKLDRMVNEDETIGAMLFMIQACIAQVEFQAVACINGDPVHDNARAQNAATFVQQMLGDMEEDWHDHLDEALTMIWAGFAPCEITLRQRLYANGSKFNDGFYGVGSLELRDQRSIVQFVYDDNNVFLGFQQSLRGAFIPAWKVANYRASAVLKRPMGKALLGNAYRVWRLKTKIQDSEAIGIERDLAGLPTFRLPNFLIEQASEVDSATNEPTDAAVKARARIQGAIDAVQKMRFNESGGLVLPSDPWSASDEDTNSNLPQYDFKITTTAGQRSIDARTAARDHDRAIARLLAMQFMQLGDRSSGSYGLSDDQSNLALRAVMGFCLRIARTYSRSVIPLVWEANGMDPRVMPRIEPKPLSKEALQAVGTYLTGLSRVMGMIQDDPKARVEALGRAGITVDPALQTGALVSDPNEPDPADAANEPAASGQKEPR